MMGRPPIRATLVLLVTLALGNISKGGENDAEQIELTKKQLDEIQASSMENTELRVVRDGKYRTKRHPREKKGYSKSKKKGGKKIFRKEKKWIHLKVTALEASVKSLQSSVQSLQTNMVTALQFRSTQLEPPKNLTANVTALEASVKSLQSSVQSVQTSMVTALQFRSSQLVICRVLTCARNPDCPSYCSGCDISQGYCNLPIGVTEVASPGAGSITCQGRCADQKCGHGYKCCGKKGGWKCCDKCNTEPEGIEGCCDRKQNGNTFYYLVAYNETSNCKSGCLYTTDVANEGEICLDETDTTCNVTSLKGFESTQERGFTCFGSITGGRYTCKTDWYEMHVVKDFSQFNMQCFTVTSQHYTFNGFKLVCYYIPDTKTRLCRYYYWCSPTVTKVIITLDKTAKTQFQPLSQSVELFTEQNVTCIGAKATFFGLQMQHDNNANMWYNLACSAPPSSLVCKKLETTSKATIDFFYPELKFQTVRCPTLDNDNYPNLHDFQLMKTDGVKLHYEYNCCYF